MQRIIDAFELLLAFSWRYHPYYYFTSSALEIAKIIQREQGLNKQRMKRIVEKARKQFNGFVKDLESEYERYNKILNFGCNDPFWSDGININLAVNHISYYKINLIKLHVLYGFKLPESFDKDIPPEMPQDFICKKKKIIKVKGHMFKTYVNIRAYDNVDKGGILNNPISSFVNKKEGSRVVNSK